MNIIDLEFELALSAEDCEKLKTSLAHEFNLEELLPKKATRESAGMDVRTVEHLEIKPGEFAYYRTGIKIKSITRGHFLLLEVRSSLRFKRQLSQLGSGIIDADFNGEICGILMNFSNETVKINAFERVAQLIPVAFATSYHENNSQEGTSLRKGGFGSTGKK